MQKIPPLNPEEAIKYIDNLDIEKKVDKYFSENDKNNSGLIDAENYKNIFHEINKNIGINPIMGKKEWEWVLNLINKKITDKLNKKEAIEIFNHMLLIARDYLHSLPSENISKTTEVSSLSQITTINENYLNLLKEHKFDGDAIKGLSINTIIDLNNEYFLATIGERGKILLDKKDYKVISYKKDHGFYVACKVNSYLISAINTDSEGTLWYSDFNLKNLEKIEIEKSELHTSWITKIVQIDNNKIATSSGDNTVKIYEIINEKKLKLKLIKTLNKHKSTVISIIKIQNKNWLISAGYDNKIIVWDLSKYTVIKEINDAKCIFINGLRELPKQRLIVSGENCLIIINYMSGKIIRKIDTGVKVCCSIVMDDSLLLMGCFDGTYLAINMKDFSVQKLKEKESNYISCMMKLGNKSFVSGLHNGIMKIYNLLE